MNLVEKLTQLIEPPLQAMGYALVQVRLMDGSRRKTLTVMAERSDLTPMGFDDCTDISHAIGALLEVEDPISGAYNLEVCSPGLDRPLVKPADFKRFSGENIKLETLIPLEGRKRFNGVLQSATARGVTLQVESNTYNIDFSNIRSAKLTTAAATPAPKGKPNNKPQKKSSNSRKVKP